MKRRIEIKTIVIGIGFLIILLYGVMMISGYQNAVPNNKTAAKQDLDGYYIFYTLLKRLGYKIEKTGSLGGHLKTGCLIYLEGNAENEAVYAKLTNWLEQGNTLFLGVSEAATDPILGIEIKTCEPEIIKPSNEMHSGVQTVGYTASRYFDSVKNGTVLISVSSGAVLFSKSVGAGRLYLCAEPALLNNRSLQDKENAVMINNLFSPYFENTIWLFDSASTIGQVANPVLVLFRGPLFFISLHLLLLAVLFLFRQAIRFGLPAQFNPYARRTIDEHVQAVGGFYLRAKAYALIDGLESSYFLFSLRKTVGDMRNKTKKEIMQAVATRYALDAELVARLLVVPQVLNAGQLLERIKQRKKMQEQIYRNYTETKVVG